LIQAARPTGLSAADNGPSVLLRWQLAPGKQYPLVVQTSPSRGTPRLRAVPNGQTATTVGGLDPQAGYCFQVGAVVAFGEPSVVAWSAQPVCVRGATSRAPAAP
jgi:hypothetical protein